MGFEVNRNLVFFNSPEDVVDLLTRFEEVVGEHASYIDAFDAYYAARAEKRKLLEEWHNSLPWYSKLFTSIPSPGPVDPKFTVKRFVKRVEQFVPAADFISDLALAYRTKKIGNSGYVFPIDPAASRLIELTCVYGHTLEELVDSLN